MRMQARARSPGALAASATSGQSPRGRQPDRHDELGLSTAGAPGVRAVLRMRPPLAAAHVSAQSHAAIQSAPVRRAAGGRQPSMPPRSQGRRRAWAISRPSSSQTASTTFCIARWLWGRCGRHSRKRNRFSKRERAPCSLLASGRLCFCLRALTMTTTVHGEETRREDEEKTKSQRGSPAELRCVRKLPHCTRTVVVWHAAVDPLESVSIPAGRACATPGLVSGPAHSTVDERLPHMVLFVCCSIYPYYPRL